MFLYLPRPRFVTFVISSFRDEIIAVLVLQVLKKDTSCQWYRQKHESLSRDVMHLDNLLRVDQLAYTHHCTHIHTHTQRQFSLCSIRIYIQLKCDQYRLVTRAEFVGEQFAPAVAVASSSSSSFRFSFCQLREAIKIVSNTGGGYTGEGTVSSRILLGLLSSIQSPSEPPDSVLSW